MVDGPRLLDTLTKAFIDRTPIDWVSLVAHTRTPSDRTFVENVRVLDAIRGAASQVAPEPKAGPRSLLLVRSIIVLSSVHVASGVVAIVLATAASGAVPDRTPQLVTICSFIAASLYLAIAAQRDERSLSLLGVLLTAVSPFVHGIAISLQGASPVFDIFVRGIFPEAFTPAFMWQLAMDFPRVQRFAFFDILARRAAMAAWLCGILVFCINLVVEYRFVAQEPFALIRPNDASHFFWYLYALVLLPALGAIFIRSRRAHLLERRRVARFALAIVIGTIPFVAFTLVQMLLPSVDRWFHTSTDAERYWLFVFVLGPLSATPILATAAVIADRPIDLESVIGPIPAYVFSRAALTLTMAAPFMVLFLTLYGSRHETIADLLSGTRGWLLFSYLAAGALLLLARSRLLNAVDKYVLGHTIDHHRQLELALQRVRLARGTREIAAVLIRELHKGTGAENVRILVPDNGSAFVDSSQPLASLARDTALIAMLRETTRPLGVLLDGPLHPLLPPAEREWVESNDVSIVAALQHRDDELAAVVVLGSKRGGVPFDRRDYWLINALTAAAATAWDADNTKDGVRDSEVFGFPQISTRNEAAFECPGCGVIAESEQLPCNCGRRPELAALPHHVGEKFVVQRRLGAGGMGVVYLARDLALGRDVALKTLPELRPGAVARLRDEARSMAALSHEALATIYGLEVWRRTPVLVVEYFPHGTLAHKLAGGVLSADETVTLGIDLAQALEYIHARDMLHRDLKPSNIAFTSAGTIKLLDFGLTTLVTSSASEMLRVRTESGDIIAPAAGTLAYLAPEAYRGAAPSAAFDLWALAVTLLESLAGRNPFVADPRGNTVDRILNANARELCASLAASHPELVTFFERALARRPEQRFQTAHEVGSALEGLGATTAAVNRGSN